MDIYSEILDRLKKEYSGGATYQKMANDKTVSYSYLRGLMNGTNPPEKLSLEVLFKLFPRATLNLTGDTISGTNSGVINAVLGVNKGTFNANCESAIIDKILKSDLSAEDKVKFIELVRK